MTAIYCSKLSRINYCLSSEGRLGAVYISTLMLDIYLIRQTNQLALFTQSDPKYARISIRVQPLVSGKQFQHRTIHDLKHLLLFPVTTFPFIIFFVKCTLCIKSSSKCLFGASACHKKGTRVSNCKDQSAAPGV